MLRFFYYRSYDQVRCEIFNKHAVIFEKMNSVFANLNVNLRIISAFDTSIIVLTQQ